MKFAPVAVLFALSAVASAGQPAPPAPSVVVRSAIPPAPEVSRTVEMVEEKYQETQWQPVIVERSRQVPIVTTVTRQRLTAPTTQVQVGCVDCNCVQTRTPVATVQVGECVDCQPAPRRVQQVAVDCVDCQNGYAAPGGVDVDVNVGRQRRGLFGWFRRRGCR